MPTDVDDHDPHRLDEELRAIAEALVAAAPEVPALQPRDLEVPSASRSRAAFGIAASIVLAGAGGLFVAVDRDGPTTEPSTTAPAATAAILLPILEGPLGEQFEVVDAKAFTTADLDRQAARALLGKREAVAIVDPVVVTVGRSWDLDTEPTDIAAVFNRTAHVYLNLESLEPITVVIGDDPYIAVSGVDPLSFLNRVEEDFVTFDMPQEGAPGTLAFEGLPEGYEVIVSPAPPPPDSVGANLHLAKRIEVAEENLRTYVDAFISVGPTPALIGRDAEAVEIGDAEGWLSSDGARTAIRWQPNETTHALLQVGEYADEDAALSLARSLRWVPVEEWAAHYDVDVDDIANAQSPQTSAPS